MEQVVYNVFIMFSVLVFLDVALIGLLKRLVIFAIELPAHIKARTLQETFLTKSNFNITKIKK